MYVVAHLIRSAASFKLSPCHIVLKVYKLKHFNICFSIALGKKQLLCPVGCLPRPPTSLDQYQILLVEKSYGDSSKCD